MLRLATTFALAFRPGRFASGVTIAAILLVAQAIGGTTGSIAGVIKDQSGAAVAGVRITLTNSGMGIKQSVTSGKNGSYRFPNVLPGEYELRTEATDFKPKSRAGLMVHVDSALRIDVILEAEDNSTR